VVEFFQLREMHRKEQASARRIQGFFRNIRRNNIKRKWLR
jgi:hypothetical protein